MQPQKAQKIELDREYPCPCRRKGTLKPIALTEALGCDRCQQIFVVEDNGHALEKLSTTYPYKRAWRWTGQRWKIANSNWGNSPLKGLVIFALITVAAAIAVQLVAGGEAITLFALFILAIASVVWLTHRH